MKSFFFSDDELQALAATGKPQVDEVFIFGAGSMGKELLGRLLQARIPVRAFLDNNALFWSERVAGLPVLSPETLRGNDTATVILASVWAEEMRGHCALMGVKDVISMAEAVQRFGLVHIFEQIESDNDASRALDVWEDAASRQTYRSLVRFRAYLDLSELPPPIPNLYFTPDIVQDADLRAIADCGAFTGDTYKDFKHRSNDAYEHYFGFEPDPAIFQILAEAVADDPRARVYHTAVGEENGVANFHSVNTGLSNVSDGGSSQVRIARLDHILGDAPVTMIKMDIEGSELAALAGGEKIIRERLPLLAISCYHQLEHFWRIPLWIKSIEPAYRLRLLHHGTSYADSVCYGYLK